MSLFISFLTGVILFYSFPYFPFTASAIFFLSLVILVFRKRYLLIPVIAAGILYAFFRYTPETDIAHIYGKEILISGMFVSDAVETSSEKLMQTFHVESAVATEANPPSPLFRKGGKSPLWKRGVVGDFKVNIISDMKFEIGSRYGLLVKVTKYSPRLSPGVRKNDNIYANLVEVRDFRGNSKNIRVIFENARAELNRYITENFNVYSGALISAITIGQRSNMSEELRDAFNSTGLAHILSISGTHFGLFSVFLFGMFRFLIKSLPYRVLQRITIYITPSQGAALLCLPFMVAYLGLSGWNIPAVRSFIMISLFLAGLLIGRKGFWLNSLLFAAFVIVLWSPDALFSLSFQLSFIAVLCIGFSVGYMEKDKESSILHVLRSSLFLTLAASLGTAPLVAYHFHYFSVISPMSNLVITPLIGFVLLPLSLLSAFVFLFTGHYVFASLVKTIADLTVYIVMSAAHFPYADIKIPAFPAVLVICFYAGVAIYLFVRDYNSNDKHNYRLALFFSLAIFLFLLVITYLTFAVFSKKHNITITYLDVGQGDAAVIETYKGTTIVVDTGKTGRELEMYLRYRGKKTVDALIISHADNDHSGGVRHVIESFKVREVWDNGLLIYPDNLLKNVIHRFLERGDEITFEGFRILVLHPYKGFYTFDDESAAENNYSLVIKVIGGRSFLFTGDTEEEAEEDMMHLDRWLKSDVIKVPHHGGKTAASEPFFSVVLPEIAVISAGRDNPFGHPHHEMLERLGSAKIYRTDMDGAVKIMEKDSRLEIKTYRDFQFQRTWSLEEERKNIKRLFMIW